MVQDLFGAGKQGLNYGSKDEIKADRHEKYAGFP
ncbi:uncharacterized protein METZ01_LOCUS423297, partial [marine metagenome]